MPLYDYYCFKCDEMFETLQSIKDESLPPCPLCGDTNVKKAPPVTVVRIGGKYTSKNNYGLKDEPKKKKGS